MKTFCGPKRSLSGPTIVKKAVARNGRNSESATSELRTSRRKVA
jgi:hypothetical protein